MENQDRVSPIVFSPVGMVHSSRKEPTDGHWDIVESFVELDRTQFPPDSLEGLSSFSHAEIIFFMDRVDSQKIETASRHPRNNLQWPKIGIFSQRGKNRPNQIGTTVSRILKVEGLRVYLSGLDAIDGTPVLDIKPWVSEFGPRGEVTQPAWMGELMKSYWNDQKR